MLASHIYRVCSCWKDVWLPHSAGRTPVRLTDVKSNFSNLSNDVLEAQDGDSGPVMGTLTMDRLVSDGNAPSCDHVVGNVPEQHHSFQVITACPSGNPNDELALCHVDSCVLSANALPLHHDQVNWCNNR